VKWFQYHVVFCAKANKQIEQPKGCLCFVCGTVLESWPLLTVTDAKERKNTDLAFQFWWNVAQERLEQKTPLTFRMSTVSKSVNTGCRVEWKVAFVEKETFNTYLGMASNTPGLKIKEKTVKDFENNTVAGVLVRLENLPPNVPHTIVSLFTEDVTTHHEFLLDKMEGLHELHGANLREWQIAQDTEDVS
jgi:hypothetical protein